ncbi:cell division protein FtsB [Vibrio sp. Of7-15]|uniref:cell division protein FtsB n=1 Tax=Vibrio sp. Of7-15 TaxID=2724879 RepID=UPI001EF1E20D|nr:cell division protein FtsB [Vibrio sp. Of7-15]MCG7499079.1 cell division protein FtsB [Vibrio sp. Of7-15]
MRLFALMLLVILGWLQFTFWFGKNGFGEYTNVQKDVEIQKQVNSGLKKRNDQMYAEIHDLKQGLEAIEERARHELGMVKEGETFFRVIGGSQDN